MAHDTFQAGDLTAVIGDPADRCGGVLVGLTAGDRNDGPPGMALAQQDNPDREASVVTARQKRLWGSGPVEEGHHKTVKRTAAHQGQAGCVIRLGADFSTG
jgi:hypothetical protein